MPSYWQHIWLLWSSAFLLPWAVLFALCPQHRKVMLWASVFTAPFGLTEPLFVPKYWNPPSLFNLAQVTGFDIESLIFSFAIGGVSAAFATGHHPALLVAAELRRRRHQHHRLALFTPALAFPILHALPWNPIYPAIASLALGALATTVCRPDLKTETLLGAILFGGYYFAFVLGLALTAPGFIARVWNLGALTGLLVFGVPVEELVFGLAFGAYWTGLYEHLTWNHPVRTSTR